MNRRTLCLTALAAAASGSGLAWWHYRVQPVSSPAHARFWASEFERPQGGLIKTAQFKGQPLLVNFWATWCPPCVQELPLLNTFYRRHAPQGWQVLGLAVDSPKAVLSFVQQQAIDFPVGMVMLDGLDLSRALGNTASALPYTLVMGADGRTRHQKMGKVSPDDLLQWASSV